jgi:ABC-type transport system substrate-binding protein
MTGIPRRLLLGGIVTSPFLPVLARAAHPADTLRFGLSSYPPNLLPWANVGTAALTVKLQIHRGLLSFGTDGKVQGELAESWERDGDTAWRFHLRDAKFHNGAAVTAADVQWSLMQIVDAKSSAYLRGQLTGMQVETPDAHTVRIVMPTPVVTLPLMLATPFAFVIAKDSLGAEGGPVGCGPYVVKAQERGVSIDLTAFPGYYKPGLPKLKQLRMIAYADENARVAALEAGDVDLIEYVPWQAMSQIEADPKLRLSTQNGPYMALDFNGGSGPFKDERLREAVAHAIRREEVVKAAFYGRGAPLEGLPILESSEFYDPKYAHGWNYDPAKAKQLMAAAGVAKGISCTLLSTAQYGMHKATAEIVQQHLGEIGIQVTLNLPDWATRITLGNRGQYEFCVQGQTADNNDPDGLSAYIDGSLPMDNSRSVNLPTPEINKLLLEGRAEFDPVKRKTIYDQMQKVAIEVVPMASLCWRAQGYALGKDVQGFTNLPGGINFYSGISIENVSFG